MNSNPGIPSIPDRDPASAHYGSEDSPGRDRDQPSPAACPTAAAALRAQQQPFFFFMGFEERVFGLAGLGAGATCWTYCCCGSATKG